MSLSKLGKNLLKSVSSLLLRVERWNDTPRGRDSMPSGDEEVS